MDLQDSSSSSCFPLLLSSAAPACSRIKFNYSAAHFINVKEPLPENFKAQCLVPELAYSMHFTLATEMLPLLLLLLSPAGAIIGPLVPFISASISINASAMTATCHATPSVQLVSHHLLQVRPSLALCLHLVNPKSFQPSSSHVAAAAWAASSALHAQHARYAAWFPYQRLGVAELDPPSGSFLYEDAAVAAAAAAF